MPSRDVQSVELMDSAIWVVERLDANLNAVMTLRVAPIPGTNEIPKAFALARAKTGTDPVVCFSYDSGNPPTAHSFPADPTESADADGDGIGDNADEDDDDDGLPDTPDANPNDADADRDGLADGKDVEFVQDAVAALPDPALRAASGGTRVALESTLEDIEALLLKGDTAAAIRKLRNVRRRLDGCGAVADSNDWVRECAPQTDLRTLVDLLIANLQSS